MSAFPKDCRAILIGCGAEKRADRCAARDLYTSRFFTMKRAFAESTGLPWAILSAEYGVLRPDDVRPPYDKSADRFTRWESREWCAGVASQLFEWQRYCRCVAIIAGEAYTGRLTAVLATLDVQVVNPCKGLGIGQQMAWFKANTPR